MVQSLETQPVPQVMVEREAVQEDALWDTQTLRPAASASVSHGYWANTEASASVSLLLRLGDDAGSTHSSQQGEEFPGAPPPLLWGIKVSPKRPKLHVQPVHIPSIHCHGRFTTGAGGGCMVG